MKIDKQKALKQIAQNDKNTLDQLYMSYREPFLNYFKRYSVSEEEIKDVYQDTMVAFYQRGVQGKLADLSSSIKTYIFGIGKNKMIDTIRKKGREVTPEISGEEYDSIEIEEHELSKEQKKLNRHFQSLGESCQKMLKMFYYRGLDINEIAEIGGYKDSNSVKSHKSRCLKQLRKMVND